MRGAKSFRKNNRGFSVILASIATFIFAVYTGLLIYSAPHNHYLGIGLYVVGVVAAGLPTFVGVQFKIIVISYGVLMITLVLFLLSTFVWGL
jgi:hypothetical protein